MIVTNDASDIGVRGRARSRNIPKMCIFDTNYGHSSSEHYDQQHDPESKVDSDVTVFLLPT